MKPCHGFFYPSHSNISLHLSVNTDCCFTGVYDQDAPESLLLARPGLYRKGRLALVYQPSSFWFTTADAFYQSVAIYYVTTAVSSNNCKVSTSFK